MEEKISEFILQRLLRRKEPLRPKESLFGAGVIDSVGHLQLITFLEKEFRISFSMKEFTWENFDTLEKITELVKAKRESGKSR